MSMGSCCAVLCFGAQAHSPFKGKGSANFLAVGVNGWPEVCSWPLLDVLFQWDHSRVAFLWNYILLKTWSWICVKALALTHRAWRRQNESGTSSSSFGGVGIKFRMVHWVCPENEITTQYREGRLECFSSYLPPPGNMSSDGQVVNDAEGVCACGCWSIPEAEVSLCFVI